MCICVSDRGSPHCPRHGADVRSNEATTTPSTIFNHDLKPGVLVRSEATGALGIVKKTRLRGADVIVGKRGKTQYWMHPEVVGRVAPLREECTDNAIPAEVVRLRDELRRSQLDCKTYEGLAREAQANLDIARDEVADCFRIVAHTHAEREKLEARIAEQEAVLSATALTTGANRVDYPMSTELRPGDIVVPLGMTAKVLERNGALPSDWMVEWPDGSTSSEDEQNLMVIPHVAVPAIDRGRLINEHATTGMRLVELRASLPEVEKQARKTPRKDMHEERAKVAVAKARVEPMKAEIEKLEQLHAKQQAALEAAGHLPHQCSNAAKSGNEQRGWLCSGCCLHVEERHRYGICSAKSGADATHTWVPAYRSDSAIPEDK